jgi:HEAT repeat protein
MRALQPDPAKRVPDMAAFGQELSTWLESAEAAGWGEEPLPGFSAQDRETATVAGPRRDEGPDQRLAPYLDSLATGPVGIRRSAAEGLVAAAQPGDGPWLAEALARAPEGARFALARALGKVGEGASLPALLALLPDPFAQREAAEAAAGLALRTNLAEPALQALREPGLGSAWRWPARAALGDEAWLRALATAWSDLAPPFRLQALEAGRRLPEGLRAQLKAATADAAGQARALWDLL